MKKLSKIQKEYLKNPCEHCGGKLQITVDENVNEIYLYCDICDRVIDSDGGEIK